MNEEESIEFMLDQMGVPESKFDYYKKMIEEKNKKLMEQKIRKYEFKPMILRILDSFMKEIEVRAERKAREEPHERGRWVQDYIDANTAGSWVHAALKEALE